MATITVHRSDLILGSCIAVFTAVLSYSAYRHLHTVRNDTRVTKPLPERSSPDLISQRTEDAIKVETLGALYDSPNHDIRQASIKLVVERVLRSEAYPILLAQIRSRRREIYTPALQSLRFLVCSSPVPLPAPAVDTFAALVSFLARANRAAARRSHHPDTDWRARTPAEQHALAAVQVLCATRLADALAAGLVARWLAHYPFGGASADPATRRAVVRKVTSHQTDDDRLASILATVSYAAEGRKQMRAAGLIGSAIQEKDHEWWPSGDNGGGDGDGSGEGVEGDGIPGGESRSYRGTRRHRDESEGELATRRRRRQAMVFNEGGGPVTRDNIYENEEITSAWGPDD